MTTIRTTTAAIVSGLLIAVSAGASWSADNTNSATTVVQKAPATTGSSQFEVLIPIVKNPNADTAAKNCRSHMYTSHDVVGDPETCFLGRMGTQVMPGGPSSGGGVL